jgi:hypothetical protein
MIPEMPQVRRTISVPITNFFRSTDSPIGVNLGFEVDYSHFMVFADAIKSSRRFD